ncbi:MAG: hypothetical protein PUG60_09725 [Lachnospiraceae bacterium]|nr:hypothetical protein [Lachnospiraceae bacterium]MDY4969699.1 hypothetical protein [Lachnospiraceae bacterium]
MKPFWIVLIVILVIMAVILTVLYFTGKKLEKKQAEQQALMDSMAQTVSLMVVDKKRMKIKEATGLPKQVLEQTPWYLKRSKVPVVKVKVGPKVMTMMCDDAIFDLLPLKTELKATVSGIYITKAKPVRGSLLAPPKKKKFLDRFKKESSNN